MKIRCGEVVQMIKLDAACPANACMEDGLVHIEGVRRKRGRLKGTSLDAVRSDMCFC